MGAALGSIIAAIMTAHAGNGFYGVISSEEQAADYVEDRMLSTLSLIAKDEKIQVELNPAQVLAYRLLGYENRAIADQDFRNDIVDAGEIGAGHQVTALYELVLVGGELPQVDGAPVATDGDAYAGPVEVAVDDLVMVKVRYKHVDASEEDAAFEVSERLLPADLAVNLEAADADLAWSAAVASFAEILKASPYADRGRLDAISAVVSAQAGRDDDRTEFAQLFATARGRM
jgi:Ca-activated chloride channel family protein